MDYLMYKTQFDARVERKKLFKPDIPADDFYSNTTLRFDVVSVDYDDDKDQLFEFITKMNEWHSKAIVKPR